MNKSLGEDRAVMSKGLREGENGREPENSSTCRCPESPGLLSGSLGLIFNYAMESYQVGEQRIVSNLKPYFPQYRAGDQRAGPSRREVRHGGANLRGGTQLSGRFSNCFEFSPSRRTMYLGQFAGGKLNVDLRRLGNECREKKEPGTRRGAWLL
jgi:hypothetical protein